MNGAEKCSSFFHQTKSLGPLDGKSFDSVDITTRVQIAEKLCHDVLYEQINGLAVYEANSALGPVCAFAELQHLAKRQSESFPRQRARFLGAIF